MGSNPTLSARINAPLGVPGKLQVSRQLIASYFGIRLGEPRVQTMFAIARVMPVQVARASPVQMVPLIGVQAVPHTYVTGTRCVLTPNGGYVGG